MKEWKKKKKQSVMFVCLPCWLDPLLLLWNAWHHPSLLPLFFSLAHLSFPSFFPSHMFSCYVTTVEAARVRSWTPRATRRKISPPFFFFFTPGHSCSVPPTVGIRAQTINAQRVCELLQKKQDGLKWSFTNSQHLTSLLAPTEVKRYICFSFDA